MAVNKETLLWGAVCCWLLLCGSLLVAQEQSIANAVALLLSADGLEQQARDSIKQSNQLRKNITAARYQAAKLSGAEQRQHIVSQIDQHTKDMQRANEQGLAYRQQAQARVTQSLAMAKHAMAMQWPLWVSNVGPLTATEKLPDVALAHNTLIRSVHPRMPTPVVEKAEPQAGMSLQLSSIAGQDLPPDVNLESFSFSRDRHYVVHIEVDKTADNSVATMPLNQLHQWRIIVSTAKGEPLEGAHIEFSGHMPGHVHGLPTQPKVEKELAPGVYQISGVKFQMQGWWVIDFSINHGESVDHVRFNVVL